MKAITKKYIKNQLVEVKTHKTKKLAIEYKRNFLRGFTVNQKVKNNISLTID